MLQSGRYDEMVKQYVASSNEAAPVQTRTINLTTITEVQSVQSFLAEQSDRAIAERRRGSDDLRADEIIGAITEEIQI